ncbi:MAG: AIPR family protein [Caldilineaceae bacterium]
MLRLENFDGVSFMIRIITLAGSQQTTSDIDSNFLEDLRLDIAKYTNSQTPYLFRFRSNESVHKQLHEKFRILGWFYEHRRGQWRSIPNAEKDDFKISRGTYRLINMVDLAQEWFSFSGQPALAIREKNSLFDAKGPYGKIFVRARCAEEFLIAHLLFLQIESRLKEKIKTAKDAANSAVEANQRVKLTTRNYLIIGRATKRAVAHMTALIGVALIERYGVLEQELATKILEITKSEELIERVYPELEDTLFRVATQMQDDKYKTLHRLLSEDETFEELYDLFQYVIQRETDKGRDVLALE